MNIQKLIKIKGITLTELGCSVWPDIERNLAYQKMNRIVTSTNRKQKTIDLDVLKRIVEVLDCTYDELLRID